MNLEERLAGLSSEKEKKKRERSRSSHLFKASEKFFLLILDIFRKDLHSKESYPLIDCSSIYSSSQEVYVKAKASPITSSFVA